MLAKIIQEILSLMRGIREKEGLLIPAGAALMQHRAAPCHSPARRRRLEAKGEGVRTVLCLCVAFQGVVRACVPIAFVPGVASDSCFLSMASWSHRAQESVTSS